MNLLNKFASVEIKADNRISEDDKAFCLRQQEAFDKSGPALDAIAKQMEAVMKEQESILGVGEENHAGRYVNGDGFSCNAGFAYGAMKQRNKTFITVIVEYNIRWSWIERKLWNILFPLPRRNRACLGVDIVT